MAPLTPIAEIGDGPRESDAAEDEHAAGSGETPPPADVHEFPMQVGDGRGEALHRNPVVLSDVVRGELEREPWQYQPYKAGDATWLHAAQRRHAHRRRPNVTIGVASVDLSGPHVATPMPGMRVGSNGARYFVVMVVRPDLSQGRRDQACQADEAGDAHVGHAADGDVAVDAEIPEPALADEVRTYNPQTLLVYVEIWEFRHQAAEAIMKMVALMREELGNFPTSLPESWTVHRLHSGKGSELLPKALDAYCLDKGIRRTTTQGYDPSANGAAEQAVGFIKRKSRFLLAGARLSSTWWGVAAKTAATYARCDVGLLSWPRIPFGTRVMAVRDPAYRDAFAARAHPAVVFGPSESVPGGYITYADGRLKDLTNVAVTSLEAHDMSWVKGNLDLWEEPVGVQRPLRPEAWDPAHAADPSVRLPRVRRQPPAEAPAPEEENPDEQQPIDRPGDQPGDYWLEPFDDQEEERIDVARREEEHNFGINFVGSVPGRSQSLQSAVREPKRSRRRKRDKEFAASLACQNGFQKSSPYNLWCPHVVFSSIASESVPSLEEEEEVTAEGDEDEIPATETADPSSTHPSPTLSPASYDALSFSDFEDEFVVGAYAGPGEYFHVHNQSAELGEKTEIANLPQESSSSAIPTIEVDSDDDPRDSQVDAGSGQAGGAPKRQRGSKPPRETAIRNRSRPRHVRGEGGRRKRPPRPRADSLPRSRLRMNVSPAHLAFRTFASNSIVAGSVVGPGGEEPTLVSTAEEPEELEPGSRIVSEGEVRAAVGAERDGWHEAARREYQESFMDMNAVVRATPPTSHAQAADARHYR